MLRVLLALLALLAAMLILALLTRARPIWRAFWTLLGLIGLYLALKLSGVIDAMAPARAGLEAMAGVS